MTIQQLGGLGAIVVILLAGAIWYFLVRPLPEKISTGTITTRAFQPAERVEKVIPRANRSLEEPPREIKYNLPDRYTFGIRLDHDQADISYTVAMAGMEKVQSGQRVQVIYLERRIPFVGRKIFVKSMKLLPTTSDDSAK